MKRYTLPTIAALLVLVLAGCSFGTSGTTIVGGPAGMTEYRRFTPASESDLAAAVAAGDVSANHVIAKAVAGFNTATFARLGFTVAGSWSADGYTYYRLKASDRLVKRTASLSRQRGIIYAEHELVSSIPERIDVDASSLSGKGAASIASVLNDPKTWGSFGHFENTKAIDAYRDLGFGSTTVYVADIDTGINRLNEDFITADGAQIIEYAKSAFTSSDHGRTFTFVGDGTPFVTVPENENWDDGAHGSHTAGTIAALGNNGKGVAGVAWKNVKLISYKCFAEDTSGSGSDWAVYTGLKDLADWRKAQGITQTIPVNMSLGGTYAGAYELEMINYALSNGIVIIASMGNDGTYGAKYPASYAGVIAVGATRGNGEKVHFSSMGKHISVMAPGYNIMSTSTSYDNTVGNAAYEDMSGTSMAAPFVTGLVAYMLTYNPTLTLDQIKTILESTADNMGPAGWDPDTGYGQVNVKNAVAKVKSGDIPAPGSVYCTTRINVSVKNINANYDSGIPGNPHAVVGQSVYLYGPDGKYVTLGVTDSNAGSTSFLALKPGTYKAVVNYLGTMKEASAVLTNSADVAVDFEFDIPILLIQTVENYAVGGYSADTIISLYDEDGHLVAGPHDKGGLDTLVVAGLEAGARYYVQLEIYDDYTGEYGLNVGFSLVDSVDTLNGRGDGEDDLFEPNDDIEAATPITIGESYGQYLGNEDWFTFVMPGGTPE